MEGLHLTILKRGCLLIRGVNRKQNPTPSVLYTILLSPRPTRQLEKAFKFIRKYAVDGYELFLVEEDVQLLDFPYASLCDCEDDPKSIALLMDVYQRLNAYVKQEYDGGRMGNSIDCDPSFLICS